MCLLSSQAFKKLYRQYELNPNELRIPMSLLEIVVWNLTPNNILLLTYLLLLGSLISIGLADVAGRRILLIISGLGMGLSNLGLVLNQVRLLNHSTLMVHMLPVSALSAFYVFFTLGFGSLPFVILGEIFPVQSKEKMMLKC